jgi:hypothetical protein
VLTSPADNVVNQPTSVSLSWNASAGASSYHLQVATNTSLTALVVDDQSVMSLSRSVTLLAPNTKYYWRVAAFGVGGSKSPFSGSWSFTTAPSVTVTGGVTFPAVPASSSDYRLVSVPGVGGLTVERLVAGAGSEQVYDWRVFRDDGASYIELGANDVTRAGEGYWLIRKGAWTFADAVTMPSLDSTGAFVCSLHAGWNIIGNPFDRTVFWSQVQKANQGGGGDSPWEFAAGSYRQVSQIEPFIGYYYFNEGNKPSLRIPYPFTAPAQKMVVRGNFDWAVQISFSSDINADRDCWLGIVQGSDLGRDTLESRKPPLAFDLGFVYFLRPEWDQQFSRFSTDYRPSVGDGQTWEFEVSNPRRKAGTLQFEGLASIPALYGVVLVDCANGSRVNLRQRPEYRVPCVSDRMRFKLLVGSDAFIKEEIAQLRPSTFVLDQNFPNPFNPSTTILFGVPVTSFVRLSVYSVLGQEVAVLVDGIMQSGFHSAEFHARNCASGTYYVRMRAKDVGEGVEFSTTRKIVLAK